MDCSNQRSIVPRIYLLAKEKIQILMSTPPTYTIVPGDDDEQRLRKQKNKLVLSISDCLERSSAMQLTEFISWWSAASQCGYSIMAPKRICRIYRC